MPYHVDDYGEPKQNKNHRRMRTMEVQDTTLHVTFEAVAKACFAMQALGPPAKPKADFTYTVHRQQTHQISFKEPFLRGSVWSVP